MKKLGDCPLNQEEKLSGKPNTYLQSLIGLENFSIRNYGAKLGSQTQASHIKLPILKFQRNPSEKELPNSLFFPNE